jgi:hypothetical protein
MFTTYQLVQDQKIHVTCLDRSESKRSDALECSEPLDAASSADNIDASLNTYMAIFGHEISHFCSFIARQTGIVRII